MKIGQEVGSSLYRGLLRLERRKQAELRGLMVVLRFQLSLV